MWGRCGGAHSSSVARKPHPRTPPSFGLRARATQPHPIPSLDCTSSQKPPHHGLWFRAERERGTYVEHPTPATASQLQPFFPRVRTDHTPSIIPAPRGETYTVFHDRIAYALATIIADIDREWRFTGAGPRAVLLISHAAPAIAAGRALTGSSPLTLLAGRVCWLFCVNCI